MVLGLGEEVIAALDYLSNDAFAAIEAWSPSVIERIIM
jgi:hypothetical protein